MGVSVEGLEGREVGGQIRDDQLEEAFGASQVFEAMLPQVSQTHTIRQVLRYQVARRLREEHLPTMPGAHDACSPMHVQANVAFGGKLWLARVQAHAHTHRHTLWPGMAGQSMLGSHDR